MISVGLWPARMSSWDQVFGLRMSFLLYDSEALDSSKVGIDLSKSSSIKAKASSMMRWMCCKRDRGLFGGPSAARLEGRKFPKLVLVGGLMASAATVEGTREKSQQFDMTMLVGGGKDCSRSCSDSATNFMGRDDDGEEERFAVVLRCEVMFVCGHLFRLPDICR